MDLAGLECGGGLSPTRAELGTYPTNARRSVGTETRSSAGGRGGNAIGPRPGRLHQFEHAAPSPPKAPIRARRRRTARCFLEAPGQERLRPTADAPGSRLKHFYSFLGPYIHSCGQPRMRQDGPSRLPPARADASRTGHGSGQPRAARADAPGWPMATAATSAIGRADVPAQPQPCDRSQPVLRLLESGHRFSFLAHGVAWIGKQAEEATAEEATAQRKETVHGRVGTLVVRGRRKLLCLPRRAKISPPLPLTHTHTHTHTLATRPGTAPASQSPPRGRSRPASPAPPRPLPAACG